MLFERFEVPGLAHYSYAVGCEGSGAVAVVDPERNVGRYLDFARARGLSIRHVVETHIHADFASGARELAIRSGAELALSRYDDGELYDVGFEHRPLADGDPIEIGSVRLQALHTPGHTPEHLSFLVYDGARSPEVPMLLLSGDFLFVGSLGRPDLLGEEAKRELAGRLFASVRGRLAGLPDGLEVHPGHGAGSMCGSGMGGRPMSTLGFERIANPYLDPALEEEAFVEKILGSVPPFPPYYRRMKELNAGGPPLLDGLPGRRPIPVAEFRELVRRGEHSVVDLRHPVAFGGGHLPGSFGIGADASLATWAAWVVPYDRPILLVADHPETVEESASALVRVGHDHIEGYLDGGVQAWAEAGERLEEIHQATPPEIHDRLAQGDDVVVIDVRDDAEWRAGHVDGAVHLFAGTLEEHLDELRRLAASGGGGDDARPLALICGGGYRSTVAASVLARHGIRRLANVTGGMNAWQAAGLPVVREAG